MSNSIGSAQHHQTLTVYRSDPASPAEPLRFKSWLLGLSWLKLLLALLIIALGSASLANVVSIELRTHAGTDGSTIWGGLFLVATAVVGVVEVRKQHRCMLITYLVLAIVAASLFCPIMFAVSTMWAAATYYFPFHNFAMPKHLIKVFDDISAMQATIAVFSFIYAVCATAVSVLLCANLCPCCKRYINETHSMTHVHPRTPPSAPVDSTSQTDPAVDSAPPPSYEEVMMNKADESS